MKPIKRSKTITIIIVLIFVVLIWTRAYDWINSDISTSDVVESTSTNIPIRATHVSISLPIKDKAYLNYISQNYVSNLSNSTDVLSTLINDVKNNKSLLVDKDWRMKVWASTSEITNLCSSYRNEDRPNISTQEVRNIRILLLEATSIYDEVVSLIGDYYGNRMVQDERKRDQALIKLGEGNDILFDIEQTINEIYQ